MKVVSTFYESKDGNELLVIEVDDKEVFRIGPGEPEDMIFSRDLDVCLVIPKLMQAAYDAGKIGEPFELIQQNKKDDY